jgi:valyl-tRNA synthetase
MPVVIAADGRLDAVADADGRVPAGLRGLDRFVARERIAELLRAEGRLVKAEPHRHAVRHCYRCGTVVEPRLSDQWFVRMEPLARPALAAVREGRIRIVPERWEAVYVNWLENIRDWNISRQLWWGHRIPVWYCDDCDPPQNVIVSRVDLAACPYCGGAVRQDEDVLDTWFSSWLWPFSTLGWPDETRDLRAFYPSDVLVTAPEILFFWVARMVMAGYRFMGDAPFHTIYLTGTARDAQHQRMSKSKGNGIDPLDVVSLYGADALRYTVVAGMGMGTDLVLDHRDLERSFAPGRNFATKLWNIGRFLLANVGGEPVRRLEEIPEGRLQLADRWVLDRLDAAIADCDVALGPPRPEGPRGSAGRWPAAQRTAGLRLDEYADAARRFVWNELADWYVEAVKARLTTPGDDREVARAVLVHAFDGALRLLHPIVPFITETLWQRLPGRRADELLCTASWPRPRRAERDGVGFELVRGAVGTLRQLRADYGIAPGTAVDAVLVPADAFARRVLESEAAVVGRLARATVRLADTAPRETAAHALLPGGTELVLPLAGVIDLEKECRKLRSELEQLVKQLGGLEARLQNESFLARAKPEVVAAERARREEWTARREQLARKVETLCG